jgi:hypothetical protein
MASHQSEAGAQIMLSWPCADAAVTRQKLAAAPANAAAMRRVIVMLFLSP